MRKKLLSSLLMLLSSGTFTLAAGYGQNHKSQEQPAIRTKRKVSKLGVNAPVIVKLKDGRKLSGLIGSIDDDSFEFRSAVKGGSSVITYAEVKEIKSAGSSGGANLGPAFLIVGAVFLLSKLIH